MQVAKWGNSLAVRIPKNVAEALKINEGDDIEFIIETDNTLTVKKIEGKKNALLELSSLNIELPKNYRFNRDEANER